MQSFLQLVAHDLYTKIGNDLSRTVLVFPNKRANLFFNEYLAEASVFVGAYGRKHSDERLGRACRTLRSILSDADIQQTT